MPGVATRQDAKTEDSRGSESSEVKLPVLAPLGHVPLLVAETAPLAQLASRSESARSAVSVESDEKQGDNGSESGAGNSARMQRTGSAGGDRFMAERKAFLQARVWRR